MEKDFEKPYNIYKDADNAPPTMMQNQHINHIRNDLPNENEILNQQNNHNFNHHFNNNQNFNYHSHNYNNNNYNNMNGYNQNTMPIHHDYDTVYRPQVIIINQQQDTINGYPRLSLCAALWVLFVNMFLPGFGTMLLGCLAGASNGGGWVCTGIMQLILFPLLLIGWFWGLYTGIMCVKYSKNGDVIRNQIDDIL